MLEVLPTQCVSPAPLRQLPSPSPSPVYSITACAHTNNNNRCARVSVCVSQNGKDKLIDASCIILCINIISTVDFEGFTICNGEGLSTGLAMQALRNGISTLCMHREGVRTVRSSSIFLFRSRRTLPPFGSFVVPPHRWCVVYWRWRCSRGSSWASSTTDSSTTTCLCRPGQTKTTHTHTHTYIIISITSRKEKNNNNNVIHVVINRLKSYENNDFGVISTAVAAIGFTCLYVC